MGGLFKSAGAPSRWWKGHWKGEPLPALGISPAWAQQVMLFLGLSRKLVVFDKRGTSSDLIFTKQFAFPLSPLPPFLSSFLPPFLLFSFFQSPTSKLSPQVSVSHSLYRLKAGFDFYITAIFLSCGVCTTRVV